MKDKIILSILLVVAISVFTFGATYAYYFASTTGNITGEVKSDLNTTLNVETIYNASKLVPLDNSLIGTAISKTTNKCIDKSGYEVCSLYKITLTNTIDTEILEGYVKTTSSTYTTNNLKYQFYNSNLQPITDIMTISPTKDEIVYFEQSGVQYSVTSVGTNTYYLAVWLTDTGSEQSADYSKTFAGKIGFKGEFEVLEDDFVA